MEPECRRDSLFCALGRAGGEGKTFIQEGEGELAGAVSSGVGRGGGTQPLRGGLAWWGGVPLGVTVGGGNSSVPMEQPV